MLKMMNGLVVGALIGAVVGVMVIPQLDRKTQRNIKRAGRMAMGIAEDTYENMMNYIK